MHNAGERRQSVEVSLNPGRPAAQPSLPIRHGRATPDAFSAKRLAPRARQYIVPRLSLTRPHAWATFALAIRRPVPLEARHDVSPVPAREPAAGEVLPGVR